MTKNTKCDRSGAARTAVALASAAHAAVSGLEALALAKVESTDGGSLPDEFGELVNNYKAARDLPDPDKAALYRNEIEAYPNYFDELVNRIP
jgi:hypothetical protein